MMPTIGYFLGAQFQEMIEAYDHWIAFGLLFLIGANMIREAIWGKEEEGKENGALDFRTMLLLAIATSIDALAVGVSFATTLPRSSRRVSSLRTGTRRGCRASP